jgi:predicted DNA-binding protein
MGGDLIMSEKYSRLLVTKLSPSVHDRLKELAGKDRRTLSALSRIIIEDYIDGIEKSQEQSQS